MSMRSIDIRDVCTRWLNSNRKHYSDSLSYYYRKENYNHKVHVLRKLRLQLSYVRTMVRMVILLYVIA